MATTRMNVQEITKSLTTPLLYVDATQARAYNLATFHNNELPATLKGKGIGLPFAKKLYLNKSHCKLQAISIVSDAKKDLRFKSMMDMMSQANKETAASTNSQSVKKPR